MYVRYAEKQGWKTDVLSSNPSDIGGMKEIIFEVRGRRAYSHFKYESGVHWVQRVPVTESSGRIHTSTATVSVMPEAEEMDLEIREDDIRVDVYRASGHGGQGVNRTDSAVRRYVTDAGPLLPWLQTCRSRHPSARSSRSGRSSSRRRA